MRATLCIVASSWMLALACPLMAQPEATAVPGPDGTMVIQSPQGPIVIRDGKPVKLGEENAKSEPDKKPDDKDKDKDKDRKGDKEKKDGKADEGAKPVQRPTTPRKPPDPAELKVRPDAQGKLRFNFTGQPWPAVLEWLAEVSGKSLDWQELPSDFLNLSTQRSYTLDEARDLINRHLLARGFTILGEGEVLSVVNLKKLDPGLVPRVEPAALERLPPYDFVRVSFALDWLLADAAAEELKPMLSPYGKLTPLPNTNRLEAMDAAVNLRDVRRLLDQEQSSGGQERLVREFVLTYARASEVFEQLQTLVGAESKSKSSGPSSSRGGGGGSGGGGGPSPEQMQQIMQQQMQQMQQQQQQPGKGGPPPAKKPAEVYLVVNKRRNSVVAQAPANKMAVIEQAVKILDVAGPQGESLLGNVVRMQVYRLSAIDPEPLVATLEELGGLDPTTRLQVDKANKSIIAYAPLADQVTIRALIDKLDGSGRRFEVMQLHRLEADYVAGTVDFLINGTKPQTQKRSYDWSPWGHEHRSSDEKPPEFRVDADVEYNRLLLWANEIELAEVRKLLVKLGEVPSEGGNPSTVRVIDAPPGKDTDQWLERLRRAWPAVGPNQLLLPAPEEDLPADRPEPEAQPPAKAAPKNAPTTSPTGAPPAKPAAVRAALVLAMEATGDGRAAKPQAEDRAQRPGEDRLQRPAEDRAQRPAAPPIRVTRTPDGKLLFTSEDPQALDKLETLMQDVAPPARADFKIYRLKYAWAYSVASNLRDIFKEDDKGRRSFMFYDPFFPPPEQEKTPTRLSKRRPLRIVSDTDSNSIFVQGADPAQARKIEDLIQFYDQPEPEDARSVRQTEVFYLKFARAKTVAEVLKDLYRDLLSPNDKALQNNNNQRGPERSYTFVFDSTTSQGEKKAAFKGPLSVGYDEQSNTLIVSAQSYLLQDVNLLIRELDKAAEPTQTTTQIYKLGKGTGATQVRTALGRMFGDSTSAAQPAAKPDANATNPQPNASGGDSSGHHGDGHGRN